MYNTAADNIILDNTVLDHALLNTVANIGDTVVDGTVLYDIWIMLIRIMQLLRLYSV